MMEFFKSQMDYIFFIYGMSFFILAAACLFLIRIQERKLPWFWLGLFAFVHAINEWMDLWALSFGDSAPFRLAHLAVLLVSFVFLAEFSWLSFLALKNKHLKQWFFIPWLFLVYLGWYFGKVDGLNLSCRYFLGFVSSFSAGVLLIIYASRLKSLPGRLTGFLGVLFISYSFTQLVIAEPPGILTQTLLNQDNFIRVFGFPIQLLRCVLAICVAFTILAYWYFKQEWLDRDQAKGKRRKLWIVYIASVYFILVIVGWLITNGVGSYYKNASKNDLLAKANTVAAAVDFRRIEALTASSADIGTLDYERLREQFMAINDVNDDLTYIYLMRYAGKEIIFLVDSEPVSSANYSPPGQVYKEASSALRSKFFSRKAFVLGPYIDRWGNWISVFAPIIDLRTSQIAAVVGMDVDFKLWQQGIFHHRLIGIFISLFLISLMVTFFTTSQINKAAVERIAALGKHLQTLIDNIPNPVFYKNAQGKYLGCNYAFAQFFGLTKEAVIGKTVFDIGSQASAEMSSSVDAELFNLPGGGSKIYEAEILDAQGIKHVVLLNKSTYPGPDGKIAGLVGVMQDITERKKIADELDQAAQEWQRTFDSIADLVFIQDKDFTILKVNKACLEALKLKPEEMIGKKCFEVIHLQDHPWVTCPFDQTRIDQRIHTEEVNDPYLGGVLLISTSPIFKENGEFIGSIHIAKDITQLKKYQGELEQKNKELEKLDQLKNDFVSIVSHELRTPLSITKEGISLVLDGVTGSINPKQSKILTTSKNNIDRLARIINSLLDISKIESGRVELKKKNADFRVLIKNVFAAFENKAKEKGLELRLDLPKEQILELYIDEDRIIQVFTNLIGNSIKFTEKGYIEVSMAQKENEVEFVVSDTGIGIAAEDLPKVFNKFLQFGRTPGAGEKGTGLGLSIAKGLIELHRGKIRVESEFGRGTKFIFSLPKYPAHQNAREYIEDAIEDAIKSSTQVTLAVVTFSYSDKIREIFNSLDEELLKIIKAQLYRGKDLALKYPNEFFIIMRDCDRSSGLIIQGRVEQALKSYFENKNLGKDVKINFGLSTYPDEAIDYQELVSKAKLA